jgi:hypothetical protein
MGSRLLQATLAGVLAALIFISFQAYFDPALTLKLADAFIICR